ncbi:YopX family protein [Parvimonas micra]
MNNLKFRAWDKTAKKMSKVTAIDFSTKPFRVFYKAYGNENYFNQDAILMQSTGLKDKNGKEIFEGDIVQYLDGEYSFVGVVENSAFGIYAKNKYDNYGFEDFADENTKEADVVVIGNIYENKELIENE